MIDLVLTLIGTFQWVTLNIIHKLVGMGCDFYNFKCQPI